MEKDGIVKKLVIIGGSAGSLNVIIEIVEQLPSQINGAIVIVLHRNNSVESALKDLFSFKTNLKIHEIEDKEYILPNSIYIAPPDYHLLFENKKCFALDSSEKLHFSRPSIDIAFESAAEIFHDKLIGVLLSGANTDGAIGLKKILDKGGLTVVQKPESAEVAYMPQSAIKLSPNHTIISGNKIGDFLAEILKIF